MRSAAMWWSWFACGPDPSTPHPHSEARATGDTGVDGAHSGTWVLRHSGHTGTPGDPTADTAGAPTGDTGEPPPVCVDPPPTTFASRALLSQVLRTEEFAFDTQGNVLNAMEGQGFYKTTHNGAPQLFSPYLSWELAGARVTPDGTALAVADEAAGRILAVNLTNGSQTVLASGLPSPNSIGFDHRGWLYVASYTQVTRHKPGLAPEVLVSSGWEDYDGIAFAPDDSAVYFNNDDTGEVWRVSLDKAGAVLSAAQILDIPTGYGTLDGMTTDVCGNLYAVGTDGRLTRVRTDGTMEVLIPSNGRYTTSVNFGSGFGGFERDHLYLMDRNSGLIELDLGIEGRHEPHYP